MSGVRTIHPPSRSTRTSSIRMQAPFTYRCNFCRDPLKPLPLSLGQFLLSAIGLRHHYCPHCFGITLRPTGLLRILLLPVFLIWRGIQWILGD